MLLHGVMRPIVTAKYIFNILKYNKGNKEKENNVRVRGEMK
jgi:hypothetical protein